MPPLMAAALASLWHTGSPYSRSMAAQPADALQTKVAKTRTAGGHTLVYLSRALARSVTVCSRGPSICPCRGSIRLRRSRRPGPGVTPYAGPGLATSLPLTRRTGGRPQRRWPERPRSPQPTPPEGRRSPSFSPRGRPRSKSAQSAQSDPGRTAKDREQYRLAENLGTDLTFRGPQGLP
jgi:hypothetical protein